LAGVDFFDASFFDISPGEAQVMDPQHRIFLECAWEALEDAGYDIERYHGRVGVYAGCNMSTYLSNLYARKDIMSALNSLQVLIGNDKDYLTTRVSYKLNLTGPSITVATTCSTSLVAVHLARQSLLDYHCDMALAGAISINLPQESVYTYEEGGIISPDGHCRAFDAEARGTIFGNGVGIVVLKRLEDALTDGDTIYAVLKGSAVNNDGALKVGYTAPSIEGQAEVIAEALAVAEVNPETLTYVETHGTGTPLGDPIEIAALTQAFHTTTRRRGYCAIGSVKTNIGHLDAAAGMAGLIKTILSLKHRLLPPSLHFTYPNPKIDFAASPFYVNTTLAAWAATPYPRRAGVTALGIGGTNAHLVLEEAPVKSLSPTTPAAHAAVLLISAKTASALEVATDNLASYLERRQDISLADVAYTTQVGRKQFDYRRVLVCQEPAEAAQRLRQRDRRWLFDGRQTKPVRTVFLFPGQGTQYLRMAADLYREVPIFRDWVETCAHLLLPLLGSDLRTMLYPEEEQSAEADRLLNQTALAQPALFVIEYALAKLWMQWGVQPVAMLGHSIGEYVAACLAGVFSLEDGLALVTARGKLMQSQDPGAMLAISLPVERVQALLRELSKPLSLAAINGPALCVVAGQIAEVHAFRAKLAQQGIEARLLHTSHAFHSLMMEPVVSAFVEQVKKIHLHDPQLPYISNITGTWITKSEATDPSYWGRHLRQTVRFAEGVDTLLRSSELLFLEVGPGQTLSTFVRQASGRTAEITTLSSLRHPQFHSHDGLFLAQTLGQLWLNKVQIDWSSLYKGIERLRVPFPAYPFERQAYWVMPPQPANKGAQAVSPGLKNRLADWFYLPSWRRSVLLSRPERVERDNSLYTSALLFIDMYGFGERLAARLEQKGIRVSTVMSGTQFKSLAENSYTLRPQHAEDYDQLLHVLAQRGQEPDLIIHLWSVTEDQGVRGGPEFFGECQRSGFYSLLFLSQTLGRLYVSAHKQLTVVSNHIQEVVGQERIYPEKAPILGLVKTIPQEYPQISCRNIDIVLPAPGTLHEERLVDLLSRECLAIASRDSTMVAYRTGYRWIQDFEHIPADVLPKDSAHLRNNGTYMIIGGLGAIGLSLAAYLSKEVQSHLVLVGRSAFPERSTWESWLETHDAQNPISVKIRNLREFEARGASVCVLHADISDTTEMHQALQEAQRRFGPIHGVIHAAGIVDADSYCSIQQTSEAVCQLHFRARVDGLFVLEKCLQELELDFCIVISSLSSILGGLEFAAYSAANIFMDAFVCKHNQTHPTQWTGINWDAWQFGQHAQNDTYGAELRELAITPDEGQQAFASILSMRAFPQIIVSSGDLQARINQWILFGSRRKNIEPEKAAFSQLHPRPDLKATYVAPTNEIERRIAAIWQELLGIDRVGIDDSFFDLGGHSLLATQLISRLREAFFIPLPLNIIFAAPTVADFAALIAQNFAEHVDSELLAELEELSQDEIQALLAGEEGTAQ
jgi:acyl transferase domain-containing protein/acyl carrier protein